MDFGCQVWSFSKLFLALKFWMVFWPFLSKKTKSAKCEKVCFVLVFAYYRKGRHVEKKRKHLQKRDKKNIDFSLKKQPKWTRKTNKNELATKIDKKAALGTHFCEKKPKLDGFWDPWGGHWEGLGWNFGPKKRKQKKHEKKQVKAQASAGHADPSKEGLEGQTSQV